jgi:uncharacterized protein (TIGR02284 family)
MLRSGNALYLIYLTIISAIPAMTNQTAAEVLNDLIQVNTERISRYEQFISSVDPGEKGLRFFFARIIGESHQNKILLATELQAMGEQIDLSPATRGLVYETARQFMTQVVESSWSRVLDQADAFEDAALRAYNVSIHAEDVAAYLRDLLIEHQARINFTREKIRLLKMQSHSGSDDFEHENS